jgi:hypothetical protein
MHLDPRSDARESAYVSTFTKTGGTINGNTAEDKHGKEVYATVWDYDDYKYPDMKYESQTGTDKLTYIVTAPEGEPEVTTSDPTLNWTRVPDKEGIQLGSRERSPDEDGTVSDFGNLTYKLRRVFKGTVTSGMSWGSSSGYSLPQDIYMGAMEIPFNLWEPIYLWAQGNGYTITNIGKKGGANQGGDDSHPVTHISWQDAVVWCNAFSEAMKKTPVYKAEGIVLRKSSDVDAATLDRDTDNANGFWLPTAEEWEYAARGGKPSATDDWSYNYAGSNTIGDVAVYTVYNRTNTDSVGRKDANRLGLKDMSGNVWELCEDKVIRGGGWNSSATKCEVTSKESIGPGAIANNVGFRVACRREDKKE